MAVPGAVEDRAAVREDDVVLTAVGRAPGPHLCGASGGGWAVPGDRRHPGGVGVNEHIRDVVRRFANQQLVAAAPDLWARVDGGAPPPGADRATLMERLGAMSDIGALDDLLTAAGWLRSHEACSGRTACIGFCMGGRLALLLAAEPGAVDRAVDCWGGRIRPPSAPLDDLHPAVPIERAAAIRVPVLGVFGAEDTNPSPDDVAALRAVLERAGTQHRVVSYEGAGHALFADDTPMYREGPAQRAWEEYLAFLSPLRAAAG